MPVSAVLAEGAKRTIAHLVGDIHKLIQHLLFKGERLIPSPPDPRLGSRRPDPFAALGEIPSRPQPGKLSQRPGKLNAQEHHQKRHAQNSVLPENPFRESPHNNLPFRTAEESSVVGPLRFMQQLPYAAITRTPTRNPITNVTEEMKNIAPSVNLIPRSLVNIS